MKKVGVLYVIFLALIVWSVPGQAANKYSAREIESLASPIALYPDTLLKDILPAATFPEQITDAALLIQNKSDAELIKDQSWDPSVKTIATYPGVLKMMYSKLTWTAQLGEAFLNQHDELLDSIQKLRSQAQEVGNLESSDKQKVKTQKTSDGDSVIVIEPASPSVVYVPQYTTTTVYTEPVNTTNYVTPLVTFGFGMAVGSAMSDDDDDINVYGYGGRSIWVDDDYRSWSDVRHDRNEDVHDEIMDRQNSRQDMRGDRQDFRQDWAKDNPGSINKENAQKFKDNRQAKLDQARSNYSQRSQPVSNERSQSFKQRNELASQRSQLASQRSQSAYSGSGNRAFSGMSSGNYSQRASQRGYYSRSYSGGGFSGARSGGFSRGGGGMRGGGGRRR